MNGTSPEGRRELGLEVTSPWGDSGKPDLLGVTATDSAKVSPAAILRLMTR